MWSRLFFPSSSTIPTIIRDHFWHFLATISLYIPTHTLTLPFSAHVSKSCAHLGNSRFLQWSPNTNGSLPVPAPPFYTHCLLLTSLQSLIVFDFRLCPLFVQCVLFVHPEDEDSGFSQNIAKFPSKYKGLYLIRKDFTTLPTSLVFALDYLRYKKNLLSQNITHHSLRSRNLFLVCLFVCLKIITKLQLFNNKCDGRQRGPYFVSSDQFILDLTL